MNEIRDIHNPFKAWLDKNKIPYHRNRPDKKTTAVKGDPDFLCTLANRCLYIECKVPGKKLSKDQEERIAYLRRAGNTVKIAYSVEDCISAVHTWLGVVNATGEAFESGKGPFIMIDEAKDIPEPVWPSDPERAKSNEAVGVSSENLFIGTIGGKDYVLEGCSEPGETAKIVRLATVADLINLGRR